MRRSRGDPLYASLNMSKLVVVAVQENIDAVSYSHAHTCTVQSHLKEFSHAYTCAHLYKTLGIFPRAHLGDFEVNKSPSPSSAARRNSRNFSTLTPAPSFGKQPLHPPTKIQGKLMTLAFPTLTPG